jgi:hypothetical protein
MAAVNSASSVSMECTHRGRVTGKFSFADADSIVLIMPLLIDIKQFGVVLGLLPLDGKKLIVEA